MLNDQMKTLALAVVTDYETMVDAHHDDTCGDYPTCVHTVKWDNARKLKELLGALC